MTGAASRRIITYPYHAYGLLDYHFNPKEYSNSYGEVFIEKALEHYLSSRLLDLNENDVFVDIAAASSPWYDYVSPFDASIYKEVKENITLWLQKS